MNRIKELIEELNKASELYYNGQESFLSDKEFDEKYDELKRWEQETGVIFTNSPTVNIGSPILSEIKKIDIKDKPMLSLDKVHSAQEIIDFDNPAYDLIASIKCDGLSVRLIYEDGELVSANSRGNGTQGGDITEHVKHFLNVPLKINKKDRYVIDGEAIIYDNDFAIVNKNNEFKNNRNTASGALSLLDMSIVKNRRLSFIAWDVIAGGRTNFYHYNMEEAEDLGFTVVPMLALDCTKVEEEEINDINKTLFEEAGEKGIPCDGIVWKINDLNEGLKRGQTAHHFLNAVAFKSVDKEYKSRLLDIEWSMGRTGVLTPIAIFEPIETEDSIIERASLHNVSVLRETLGRYPDLYEEIWVAKANQIIPQIVKANKNDSFHDHILENGLVTHCPVCGGQVEIVQSDSGVYNAICNNPKCEGKLVNIIDHYFGIKGLNVKGISKKTIEKLIDWGWVKSLKDMYKLHSHQMEWINQPGFGKASVFKILDAIDDSKKDVELASFISAIGIPLVGRTIAKEIVKYYDTWYDFKDAVGGDWTEFNGFGDEINYAINNFDYSEIDEIAEMLAFEQPEVQPEVTPTAAIQDKIFVCTGSLKTFANRNELKADIEVKGGKMTSSVTSKTNYLITNTPNSGTAKNRKAQELGVSIITEDDYIKMSS